MYTEAPTILMQGAVAGFIFGFLLQKGKVSKFDVIVNQLLLKDFTMIKIMLSAVLVGGIGVHAFKEFGLISQISIEPARLLANSLGGIIFGLGMAILGYCPGTAVAAAGDGAKDALFGILGLIVGSAIYAKTYPWLTINIIPQGNMGAVSMVSLTGIPAWLIFTAIASMLILGQRYIKNW